MSGGTASREQSQGRYRVVKILGGCGAGIVLVMSLTWLVIAPPSITRSAFLAGQERLTPAKPMTKVVVAQGDAERAVSLMTFLTCEPDRSSLARAGRATVKASLRLMKQGGTALSPDETTERAVPLDPQAQDMRVMVSLPTVTPRGCLGSGCIVEAQCLVVDESGGGAEIAVNWKTESRVTFRAPKLPSFSRVGWVNAAVKNL